MRDEPRPWARHAACKDMDFRLFFPEKQATAKAVQACSGCPVRVECLIWAIENDEHGLWGGLSHRKRHKSMLPALYDLLKNKELQNAS